MLIEVCRICGSDMIVYNESQYSDKVRCIDCGEVDLPISLRWIQSRPAGRWVVEERGFIKIKCKKCNHHLLVKTDKPYTFCDSCKSMISVSKCEVLSKTYGFQT